MTSNSNMLKSTSIQLSKMDAQVFIDECGDMILEGTLTDEYGRFQDVRGWLYCGNLQPSSSDVFTLIFVCIMFDYRILVILALTFLLDTSPRIDLCRLKTDVVYKYIVSYHRTHMFEKMRRRRNLKVRLPIDSSS